MTRRTDDGITIWETCITCFQVMSEAPPGTCEHRNDKHTVERATDKHDARAICIDCGVIIEHSESEKSWKEVRFNGYVIEEQEF